MRGMAEPTDVESLDVPPNQHFETYDTVNWSVHSRFRLQSEITFWQLGWSCEPRPSSQVSNTLKTSSSLIPSLKSHTFSHTSVSVSYSLEGFLVRVDPLFPQRKLQQPFSMDRETSSPHPAGALLQATTQTSLSRTAHITTCPSVVQTVSKVPKHHLK